MVRKLFLAVLKDRFQLVRACTIALLCLVTGILIALSVQYYQFSSASSRLLELKEEYRVYTFAIKKMLDEKVAEGTVDEKKKGISSPEVTQDGCEKPFLPVNRDNEHLFSSALAFASKHSLAESVSSLYEGRQWEGIKSSPVASRRSSKRRRRSAGGPPLRKAIARIPERTVQSDFLFSWPVDRSKFWLSSLFGPRKLKNRGWKFHYGIDMAAIRGTPVVAAATGIVLESCWHNGYGNCIIVTHNRKYKTRYAHLAKRKVRVGQKVERGEIIGTVGDTGLVSKSGQDASHLHFEVYAFGRHINPLSVLV